MDILNDELNKFSFKEIKNQVEQIDLKQPSIEKIINRLTNDKRKNVISLGEKIIRDRNKLLAEIERVKKLYQFDRGFEGYKYVAGVDEVGRGPLAGPIVACAVILDPETLDDDLILGINDSKKVSEKKREELAKIIEEKAISYSIAECSNVEIDEKGIAYANNKVFLDSIHGLTKKPDLVLSDGYRVKNLELPNEAVIKGDTKSAVIAAASICAKVYRDNLMKEYAKKYPYYNFESNVGYGASKHLEAIKEHGICDIHRKSFLTKILK